MEEDVCSVYSWRVLMFKSLKMLYYRLNVSAHCELTALWYLQANLDFVSLIIQIVHVIIHS